MRRVSLLFAVLVAAGALSGCRHGPSDPAPGEARLVERSGTVEVSADGRTWKRASEGTLHRRERVRVRAGSAVLALADGARVELRDGSHVAVGRPLRLVAGDLLVRAGDGAVPIDASSAVASVTTGGDARLARGLALDTTVYDGAVDLRSGSRTFRVRALRQASVAGVGLVPNRALPLRYDPGDAWDREFLGEWMAIGNDLDARSRGLTGRIGGDQGRTAGFYRLLLPQLEREPTFTQELVDADADLTPGERLVGAAIAVAGTRGGGFADRWKSVFAFRDDGAAWGLVALDQRVREGPALVTEVDAALSRAVTRPDVVAAAAVTPASDASRGTTPTGGGSSAPATPPSTPPSTPSTTAPSTPPTTAPPPVPTLPLPTLPPSEPSGTAPPAPEQPSGTSEPAPTGDTIGELTDPLVDTVGGLLGGLTSPTG